jgi:hypothetical protein
LRSQFEFFKRGKLLRFSVVITRLLVAGVSELQLVHGQPFEVLVHLVDLGMLLALRTSVSVPIGGLYPIALNAPLTKQDVALVALNRLDRNTPTNQALKVLEEFLALNDLV